jgi:hypothetical protein
MRCSTLTCTFASLTFLTTDKTEQQQTAGWGMTLEQCFHLNILLLSTDRAAFLNYEQIIIHIFPRLVLMQGVPAEIIAREEDYNFLYGNWNGGLSILMCLSLAGKTDRER